MRTSNLFWLVPAGFMNFRVILNLAVAGVVFVVCIIFVRSRKISWPVLALVQPLSNIYSVAVLAEWFGPLEAVVSWLPVLVTGGDIHHGMPMFLASLVVLVRQFLKHEKAEPLGETAQAT